MTNPTTYRRPQSLDEAIEYLAEPDSIALAGGALLFGGLELPFASVIDLQDITELQQIERTQEGITIGGAAWLQDVVESPYIFAALKRSITRSVPLNIRNRTSVAESVMVAQPPCEWAAALVALDARVEQVGPDREDLRLRTMENFLQYGDRQHAQSIITKIYIPLPQTRAALGTAFVARTPADEAIVCAAVAVTLNDSGRVTKATAGIAGASAQPVLQIELSTLIDNPLDEANIGSAAKLVPTRVSPVGDYRGSEDYRREMARVLTQRALLDCLAQLQ